MGYTNDLQNRIAYLSLLCVKEKYRGQGIAKKLLILFFELCKEKEMKTIHLYTHKTNISAINLYKSIGMKIDNISDRPDDIHLCAYL